MSRVDYSGRPEHESLFGRPASEQAVEARVSSLPLDRRSHLQNVALGHVADIAGNHFYAGGGRSRRNRQFGSRLHVDGEQLPCTPIGRPPTVASAIGPDPRVQNDTVFDADNDDEDDDEVLRFQAFPSKKG